MCRRYCSSPHQSLHRPLPEHSSTDRPLSAACPVPSASNVVTASHVFSHALDDGRTLMRVLQRIDSTRREEVLLALYIKGEVKRNSENVVPIYSNRSRWGLVSNIEKKGSSQLVHCNLSLFKPRDPKLI